MSLLNDILEITSNLLTGAGLGIMLYVRLTPEPSPSAMATVLISAGVILSIVTLFLRRKETSSPESSDDLVTHLNKPLHPGSDDQRK